MTLCLAAVNLSHGGRTNILYNLAKGMGTLKLGFPINKMSMGLVKDTVLFFDNLHMSLLIVQANISK